MRKVSKEIDFLTETSMATGKKGLISKLSRFPLGGDPLNKYFPWKSAQRVNKGFLVLGNYFGCHGNLFFQIHGYEKYFQNYKFFNGPRWFI